MRLAPYCGLLFLRAVLLTSGYTLRGKGTGPDTGPPAVSAAKNDLQIATAKEKISALNVKSMTAANSAQAAAAQANTARIHVEEIYMKTKNVMPELNAIKKVAKTEANSANEASKDTIATYKAMEKQMAPTMNNAKLLAVAEVKKLLKDKYHKLSDWRHKVLANPWAVGQVEAIKAATPYWKTMGSFANSMAIFGLESGAMKSKAAADLANSKSLAAGVEGKKEAGDPIGAAQDLEMSVAMKTQSDQLAARASTLDSQIKSMANVVPQYAGAAHAAAWNAEFAANPDSVPPPPVDPNFAFTPAPPELK